MNGRLVGAPRLRLNNESAPRCQQVIDPLQQRVQPSIPAVQVHPLGHAQAQNGVIRAIMQALLRAHSPTSECSQACLLLNPAYHLSQKEGMKHLAGCGDRSIQT